MSYLRYMCLFGLSLPPVVCRRAHVLFTLYVFVWFQLFVGGLIPPVVCRRTHVLFTLYMFVWFDST